VYKTSQQPPVSRILLSLTNTPRQNHFTMQIIVSGLCIAAFATAATCSKIQWRPCPDGEFNTTIAVQCGTLRVPLDYTLPNSSKTLDLELVKIPATVQPSRGSIQLNFGGPGLPTRQDAVALGPLLQV
jgi:hypothetical protein